MAIFFIFLFHKSNIGTYAAFYKFGNNPLITPGSVTGWNGRYIYGSSVVLYPTPALWYTNVDINDRKRIDRVETNNLINWTNNVNVINWDVVDASTLGVEHPVVTTRMISGVNTYEMWFGRVYPGYTNYWIYYTRSSNGINWQYPSPINFTNNLNTSWDARGITAPAVIFDDSIGKYRLWYSARSSIDNIWRVGYAFSSDGIHWEKYSLPVISPQFNWEGLIGGLGNPSILKKDDVIHIYYHGDKGIGHAITTDGINIIKDPNPVLEPSQNTSSFDYAHVFDPFYIEVGDIGYLFYNGVNINNYWSLGVASTEPILTISPIPSPTSSPTPTTTPTPSTTLPEDSPTPTPSTTDSVFKPIIIVPGMGASWNPKAIFSCKLDTEGAWTMAPYVSAYKPLMKTLSDGAKLKLNKDFYIYPYDWRKPVADQSNSFGYFIDRVLTDNPAAGKVRLVGHSMGGLLIRNQIQNPVNAGKIDSAMTIGTPHLGSVLAYPAWENGEIWSDNRIEKIALTLLINHCQYLLHTHKSGIIPQFGTRKEILQQMSPSVRDLLPVFDSIRNDKGQLLSYSSMFYKNLWMTANPFSHQTFYPEFHTLSGKGVKTLEFINTVSASDKDLSARNWPDGKPKSKDYSSEGDGTVLYKSSNLDWAEQVAVEGNHGKIVTSKEALKKILAFLNVNPALTENAYEGVTEDGSSFEVTLAVTEPARITVTAPDSRTISAEDGILVLYDPSSGDYRLEITPQENTDGLIHVMETKAGQVEEKFRTYEVKMGKNQKKTYYFKINRNNFGNVQLTPGN